MEGDSLQTFAVEMVGRHDPKLAVDEACFTSLILSYDASTIPICCESAMQSPKKVHSRRLQGIENSEGSIYRISLQQ